MVVAPGQQSQPPDSSGNACAARIPSPLTTPTVTTATASAASARQDRPAAVDAEGENAAHHEDDGRADEAGPGDPVGQHERGLGFPGLGDRTPNHRFPGSLPVTPRTPTVPHTAAHERQNGCDDRQDTHGQPFYDFASLPTSRHRRRRTRLRIATAHDLRWSGDFCRTRRPRCRPDRSRAPLYRGACRPDRDALAAGSGRTGTLSRPPTRWARSQVT